jgi:hypothetical protein
MNSLQTYGTPFGSVDVFGGVGRFGGIGAQAPAGGSNPSKSHLRLDSKDEFYRYMHQHVGWRNDAGLTAAYARQLEHIMAKAYEARYQEYRAREFFPVNTEVDPGALSFTYRMTESVGLAAVINNGNANDLPNADAVGSEFQAPVVTLGVSYNFSVLDQMAAAMAQLPIEAMKAKAARRAIDLLEEQVFALGIPSAGVAGVTNVPGLVATAKVSTGTWVAQILAAATTSALTQTLVGALASDINAAAAQIMNQSGGTWEATNVLLPVNLYSALKTVPQSTVFNSKSLLQFLEEQTGLTFDMWPILLNAGAIAGSPLKQAAVSGGNPQQNTRIFVYAKDPEVMQLIVPQPFTQLAPQPTNLVWQVPCYSRIGGAMSVQPLGATYIDGC